MTKVAIIGFGIEGQDAAQHFLKKGAEVTVLDQKEKEETDTGEIRDKRLEFRLGEGYLKDGLEGFDLIVRSPGVRPDVSEILEAIKRGAKLTNNTQLFLTECKKPIVGVTGTKGKGTTSTMIAKGLEACGRKVFLAGNIGGPVLSGIDEANSSDYAVLELSSFQTMQLTKSPHVVVITNITSDHMDWHTDQEEYEKAKVQLWTNQTSKDFLIINKDDKTSVRLSKDAPGKVVTYNSENDRASELTVLGKHNVYNANAALCSIKVLGEDTKKAWKGIAKFEGLEHRLEKVAEIDDVLWVNDSYATNPEPTKAALLSFNVPKILIAGGSEKNADFTQLGENITAMNVKALLLIGITAGRIEEAVKKAGYDKPIEKGFADMPSVVKRAAELAQKGDVVLLSPACASFGMFENYKDRGKKFKEAVKSLKI